ncbi:MAG: LON peptidase substrate-binding domain-containing protein [Candidatus Atelocyanobacterium thalassa]
MVSMVPTIQLLPLFPLSKIVLFPGHTLLLHIVEFCHRTMIGDILEGSHCFGVVNKNPTNGNMESIGVCAEVVRFQNFSNDHMELIISGQKRFRILKYTKEKPYKIGLVEWLQDKRTTQNLYPLSNEVKQLLQDVIHLSAKLMNQEVGLPNNLPILPLELSYLIGASLRGMATEQQILLETQETQNRLQRELKILTIIRNHLAAKVSLKDIF